MAGDRDAPFRPLFRESRRPQPPPRAVPLPLRMKLRIGSVFGILGWAFMAFGSVFVWGFVANSELLTVTEFDRPLRVADGTVTRVSGTSMSENDHTVMKVAFEFSDSSGTRQRNASYTTGATPAVGHTVQVEYERDDATTARIRGMRARPFSAFVGFVLVFPGIGLVFAVLAWRRGSKAVRLLAIGALGEGKRIGSRTTNTRINDQMVMEYTFEFEVGGRTYTTTGRTHRGELTDDELEPLLYDPNWPGNATLLDHLPGAPKIGEAGEITSTWTLGAVVAVLLPALFGLVNAVGWLIYTG